MLTSEHQGIRKLSHQDIINERPVPEIKVCSKQRIIYRLAKTQTLQKRAKKQKTKHQIHEWRLRDIHAPNTTSVKLSLWSKKENASLIENPPKQIIDYKLNANNAETNPLEITQRYHAIGLHSMQWTRRETDLLLTLCNNFGTRWSIVIDRYNACKPMNRPTRNITQIKQRYYECKNLIESFTNNNHEKFEYDAIQEQHRRNELSKLLMRSHDDNIEISQTAQYYRKHNKLLRKKVSEMQKKKMQLMKQSTFIRQRQQMTSKDKQIRDGNNDTLPFNAYQRYGVIIQDTLRENNDANAPNIDIQVPSCCIPKKVKRIKRHIQMIDDEYTKYKYELKLDGHNTTVVPFPYVDKAVATQQNKYDVHLVNNKKKKKTDENQTNASNKNQEQLLVSSNACLGKDIAKIVQQELVHHDVISVDPFGNPRVYPMTNTTRNMVNVLREDYIKYYALQTLINDMKKKQAIKK